LAHIVGPTGHVTALDPAELGYGGPFTLGEAQEHLRRGVCGEGLRGFVLNPVSSSIKSLFDRVLRTRRERRKREEE
jgi:hypothetical protein